MKCVDVFSSSFRFLTEYQAPTSPPYLSGCYVPADVCDFSRDDTDIFLSYQFKLLYHHASTINSVCLFILNICPADICYFQFSSVHLLQVLTDLPILLLNSADYQNLPLVVLQKKRYSTIFVRSSIRKKNIFISFVYEFINKIEVFLLSILASAVSAVTNRRVKYMKLPISLSCSFIIMVWVKPLRDWGQRQY